MTQARGGGAVDWLLSEISTEESHRLRIDWILLDMMLRIAELIQVRPLGYKIVNFDDDPDLVKHGISIALVIAESHMAIHTWPETGEIRFTINTCREPIFDCQEVEVWFREWFGNKVKIERWQHDYRKRGEVTKMEESRPCNPVVAGSNPALASIEEEIERRR